MADIKAMRAAHEDSNSTQTLTVSFNRFSTSSLDIMIYTVTKTTVWVSFHAVKQAALLKVGRDHRTPRGADCVFQRRRCMWPGWQHPNRTAKRPHEQSDD